MDLGSASRSDFAAKALSALDRAAGRAGPTIAMTTLGVLLELTVSDAAAPWQRIWLEFGELDPSAADRPADPQPEDRDLWNGRPVTATCATAIRAAIVLAGRYDMTPAPPGVLALCLVGEPTTAASRALGATSEHAHTRLLDLVQEALVGSSWPDIKSVLKWCFDQAAIGADPDFRRFSDDMAGQYEALMAVLTLFLRAGTPAQSGALIEEHPELLSEHIDRLLARFIGETTEAGDAVSARRLRERRAYLASYRGLTGNTLPPEADVPDAGVRRYGECPAARHRLEHSVVEEPGCISTAMRCGICHVGFRADLSAADDGIMDAECFIFPADGCDSISPEMTMWALTTWGESVSDLEAQGVPVRRATPVIGYLPGVLSKHTTFIPDSDS